MKLYIPEIGDKLKLDKDWKFELHAEYRNVDLAAFFGYYYSKYWIDKDILLPMRDINYVVQYPTRTKNMSYHEFERLSKEAEKSCPECVKYWSDYKIWSDQCDKIGLNIINVTLPAGTELKVDRIYIRKGASDYSSITFYVTNLGKVFVNPVHNPKNKKNKSSLRFWAKLSDCNNIVFKKKINI